MDEGLLRSFLGVPELSLERLRGGFSNLTYLARSGSQEWVVREPPVGSTVRGAHDMKRECLILSRLAAVYPFVPRVLGYCEEGDFFVMERVEGLILRTSAPPDADFARLSCDAVDNLARLHSVDYRAAGLEELARPEGYVERQIRGWTERYGRARTDDVPDVDHMAAWLASGLRGESGACLIHNDFKYDNLVLASDYSLRAVLDWEMATVGDPLMDLGSTLGYWVQASDPPALLGLSLGLTHLPGNLTRAEVVSRYARVRPVDDPVFYYVYGLFKLIGIAQQIYFRYKQGKTDDARFAGLGHAVKVLAAQGREVISRGEV